MPPIGRIVFTLNPFKMLNQLIGAEFRKKIYCCCCVTCLIGLFILILPNLIARLIVG